MLCTYLSRRRARRTARQLANTLFGWSWADPIASLIIAGIAVREGINAWRGDACCAIPANLKQDNAPTAHCDCC